MKSTCRKCLAFEFSRDADTVENEAFAEPTCVLGVLYCRAGKEGRPLQNCPKPKTWTELVECAAKRGIELPHRDDDSVIPAKKQRGI